ncbi:solute carrier organic anion transporter family [Trichuris trichiura]|uniref:Solute carrier organic anion transporter family member n=1 Tax=Trichuris trichiura TaxID=36087 RepID=A0A077Z7T9_TRITR|nr:solute carrier organic anion transporter family [Trichuris trichiura]
MIPTRASKWINIRLFSLLMCIVIAIQGTYLGYIVGVLTSIEKRFEISSSMSGTLLAMYDIGHTLSVLLVGYFYADCHKPRVIVGGVLLSSVAMFLLALPNFVFGPTPYPPVDEIADQHANGTYGCRENMTSLDVADHCPKAVHGGAYAIMILAQLLAGISAAPFNTIAYIYIDDNVSHRDSPFYLGLLTGMYAFGPAFGFLLSTIVSAEHPVKPSSHYRIGAWWLGFVICALLYIIFSIPLFLFPRRFPIEMNSHLQGMLLLLSPFLLLFPSLCSALPAAICSMLRNQVYSSMVLGWIFGSYLIGGYGTYLPKFIETQFEQSASMADIYAGLISIGSVAVSTALGGYLLTRFNIQPRLATLLLIITWVIIFFTYLLGIAFGCDQLTLFCFARWNFTTECSKQCNCPTQEKFLPVCDGKRTYFSACHAGCSFEADNNTWLNCKCAEYSTTAEEGFCKTGCTALPMYITTMFVGLFLGNLFFMTTMTVVLRCVDVQERSLALSLASFLTNILGFIPSPIIFGLIIDSACIAWYSPCNDSGNCVLYDNMSFRYKYHSGNAAFQLAAILVVVFTYYKQENFAYPESEDFDNDNDRMYEHDEVKAANMNECGPNEKMLTQK